MSEINSTIRLSLHDAANNCVKHNAIAVLTLRSGVQLRGGWITALMEEIVAVEAVPQSGLSGSFGDRA